MIVQLKPHHRQHPPLVSDLLPKMKKLFITEKMEMNEGQDITKTSLRELLSPMYRMASLVTC